ncbi:MAG: nucleotide exchange factor GrpE [Ignavibacterium sp.]|nr:nucleotide exchange factor GrpE [Ignavibacterium sp.]MDW8374861.1 nucleotide exchange factor GrpE [Ignavibacteriales bacterium]
MSEEKKEELKEETVQDEKSETITNEASEQNELIQLKQQIEELEKERDSWKDKFLRKAAEFENYKKRVENEQLALINYAAESFIRNLLPVIDDFERSLKHFNDAQDINSIKTGIELIYNKFIKILTDFGVKKIESVGQPFDVHFHEAIMQKEDHNNPPHTVLEEIEKGYMLKDKVIRFAKVIVSSDHQTQEQENV